MSQHKIISHDLVVSLDKSKSYHTNNFSSEENSTLGKLFVLSKIKTKNIELKKIINSLIKFINQSYLNQAHPNAEESLEEILQQANQEWQTLLADSDISLGDPDTKKFFSNLDMVVGIMQDTTVHFAYVGQTNVFLVRKNNIIDILESMDSQEEFNFLKIFGNIVTGNLKNSDTLFFSFEDFVDYFSTEKIKRIVTDYTPSKACNYFKELLKPLESEKVFNFMIFKVKNKAVISTKTKVTHVPVEQKTDSMQELVLKQQQTQEFIKPKITPKLKKDYGKKLTKRMRRIFSPCKKLYKHLVAKFKEINFKSDIDADPEKIKFSDNKKNIEIGVTKKQSSIYLPKQNKVYLIISLIFVALLGGIIFYSINHQAKRKRTEEYQRIVTQIEEKQNLISAAMMYDNNNRAQELLGEIEELIAQVPDDGQELQAKYEELKKANQEKLDELLKLYVANPEKVAEFTYDTGKLVLLSNNIYTWKDNTVVKLDLGATTIHDIASLKEDYGNISQMTVLDETSILIRTSTNKFVRLAVEEKLFFDVSVETDKASENPTDIITYSGRLYVLDSETSQIYKYQNDDGNFTDESTWLTDSTDLSGLTNMIIDGNIWSIDNAGSIYKFYTGEKEPYSYEIQPEIVNSTKIYTEIDWVNLYILDPGSNRIIILNKSNGQILKQYHSDKFDNLKDMVVMEAEKTIYVSGDKVVYKIEF